MKGDRRQKNHYCVGCNVRISRDALWIDDGGPLCRNCGLDKYASRFFGGTNGGSRRSLLSAIVGLFS